MGAGAGTATGGPGAGQRQQTGPRVPGQPALQAGPQVAEPAGTQRGHERRGRRQRKRGPRVRGRRHRKRGHGSRAGAAASGATGCGGSRERRERGHGLRGSRHRKRSRGWRSIRRGDGNAGGRRSGNRRVEERADGFRRHGGDGLGREVRGFRRCRWCGRRPAASGWTCGAGGAEIGAGTVWTLAEVTDAPAAVGSAPPASDAFSTLSAEPAASDSAAPKTATAAADDGHLLRMRRQPGPVALRRSRRSTVASRPPATNRHRSADRCHDNRVGGRWGGRLFRTRQPPGPLARRLGRCEEPASIWPTVASAAPSARASWMSTESKTGIGRASPIGSRTSSRSSTCADRGTGSPATSRPCGKPSSASQ